MVTQKDIFDSIKKFKKDIKETTITGYASKVFNFMLKHPNANLKDEQELISIMKVDESLSLTTQKSVLVAFKVYLQSLKPNKKMNRLEKFIKKLGEE